MRKEIKDKDKNKTYKSKKNVGEGRDKENIREAK